MSIYTKQIDGELVKIDTEKLQWLWSDGKYGNKPRHLYRQDEGRFWLEEQNHWQGHKSTIKELSKDEAVEYLKKQTQHPTRQLKALEKLGVEVKEL